MVRVEVLEELRVVGLRVARHRRRPQLRVERPAGLDLLDDRLLQGGTRVKEGLELFEADDAVAIRVHLLEHLLVQLKFLARALLEAERAERAPDHAIREGAAALGVELLEDLAEVNLRVARHGRRPLLLIEFPTFVKLLLDLGTQRQRHVRIELFGRQLAIAIGVHRLEGELVEVGLLALALGQADGVERAPELAHVEEAVAIRVELHEDLAERPLGHTALAIASWDAIHYLGASALGIPRGLLRIRANLAEIGKPLG